MIALLSGVWGKVISYVGVAVVAAGLSGWLTHRVDASALADLKAAHATAAADAIGTAMGIQKAADKITLNAAIAEAKAQAAVTARTITLTKEIPVYVTAEAERRACVPVGVVRLLDAFALGVDPATLSGAAADADDACAPIKAADFSARLLANYAAARANAEQLNALIAWALEQEKKNHDRS